MKFEPRDYQQRIIEHCVNNRSAFVLAQMGSGKTASVLESFRHMDINRVLIVAPLRVAKHTWPDEIAKWDNFSSYKVAVAIGTPKKREEALNSKARVIIINQENIAWLIDKHANVASTFDMIVVDESSAYKNPSSKRFKALKKLKQYNDCVARWVLLTATPTPNSLMEAWSQMFLIDQGSRLGTSYYKFRERYFTSDYMGYKWEVKPALAPVIRKKIAETAIVVERYDGLPDRVDLIEEVVLPKKAMQTYDELEEDQLIELVDSEITAVNAAVLVGKLQQLAGGAIYDDGGNWGEYHTAKLEALDTLLEQAEGENVLVAYNYKHEYERIKKAHPHAVSIKEPDAIARWNRGEIKLLLAHPASAAHGLNLQDGGRRIIWFSPTWSNELKMQFDARLHRQGQTDHVYIHTICAADTIDYEVIDAVTNKRTAQDVLLAAVKKYRK